MQLVDLAEIPIDVNSIKTSANLAAELKQQNNCVQLPPFPGLWLANTYYHDQIAGTTPYIFAREAVLIRLKKIAAKLAPVAGLVIYDIFRTKTAQQALLDSFYNQVKSAHPDWTEEEVMTETRKFVSVPAKDYVPPHNSGGAIDLAIFKRQDSSIWDFGAELDELSDKSATAYFENDYEPLLGFTQERWLTVRRNRRILFHLMLEQGFTNYENEWWHYDLGDVFWCKRHKVELIFDSMEKQVLDQLAGLKS